MNAAARLLNQSTLSRGWIFSIILSRFQYATFVLILAVTLSALGVVYVTSSTRSLNAAIQQTLAERDQLHIHWGQLLLERGTWAMQARIQRIAEEKLGMVIPDSKSILIISSK